MRFREATATIGPIIQGIGVWSWLNTNPAGIPIAKALRIPGIWWGKYLNSCMRSCSLRATKSSDQLMRRSNLSIAWSWKNYERFGLSVRRREGGQVKPVQARTDAFRNGAYAPI